MAKVDVTVTNNSGRKVGVRFDEKKGARLIERLRKRAAAEKIKSVSVKKAPEPKKAKAEAASTESA